MHRRRILLVLLAGLVAALGGCNRQDAECLGSMGRKILDRADSASVSIREKLGSLKSSVGGTVSPHDRVALRLRWDKALADVSIEVVANSGEIELKGSVRSAEQRTRATELAESTAGVDRVLVSLTVAE